MNDLETAAYALFKDAEMVSNEVTRSIKAGGRSHQGPGTVAAGLLKDHISALEQELAVVKRLLEELKQGKWKVTDT